MALIGLGEFIRRVAHAIFKKRPKEDRIIDGLWASFGAGQDDARDQIVAGLHMMHPGDAEGNYLDRHAADKGGLSPLPGESDGELQQRVGNAFEFWRNAGTTDFLVWYAALLDGEIEIAVHPTRPYVRIVTINTIPSDQVRFYSDMHKFRPAHQTFLYELGPGLDYRRLDATWRFDAANRFNLILEV